VPEPFRTRPARLPAIETRGFLPFVLMLPLLPALAFSLARGSAHQVMAEIIALAGFGGGAWLLRRSLHKLRQHRRASARFDRWAGTAALTVASVACNGVLIGHPTPFVILAGGLVMLGCWLSYAPATLRGAAGAVPPSAREQLETARCRIAALEETAGRVDHSVLRTHLERIAEHAGRIVARLSENPRDISTAQRFLAVYLDGALSVCQQYERTALQHGVTTLEPRFIDVLASIERVFEQQYQRLLADDILDLDVQIEVLKTRLDTEGIA
jgi:hypothetical protein